MLHRLPDARSSYHEPSGHAASPCQELPLHNKTEIINRSFGLTIVWASPPCTYNLLIVSIFVVLPYCRLWILSFPIYVFHWLAPKGLLNTKSSPPPQISWFPIAELPIIMTLVLCWLLSYTAHYCTLTHVLHTIHCLLLYILCLLLCYNLFCMNCLLPCVQVRRTDGLTSPVCPLLSDIVEESKQTWETQVTTWQETEQTWEAQVKP